MQVVKRDGTRQDVDFNRVARRNTNLARPDGLTDLKKSTDPKVNVITRQLTPLTEVDPNLISKEVIRDIHDGVTTVELDIHSAKIAQSLCTYHPQYGTLAGRIYMSNYHKNNIYDLAKNEYKTPVPTSEQRRAVEETLFLKTADALWYNTDKSGKQAPLLAPHVYQIIKKNAERFEKMLDYTRDFNFDFLGMTMMEKKYLLSANLNNGHKMHRVPIERPQHMIMRVAIGLHCSGPFKSYTDEEEQDFELFENVLKQIDVKLTREEQMAIFTALLPFLKFPERDTRVRWEDYDLDQYTGRITDEMWENIKTTYNIISRGEATHATPTLFNAGTLRPQCSSCFLVMLPADSLEGIARFFTILMHIQKGAGGLGSNIHNLRSAGSYIRGTNGTSNGITPFAKVVNAISIYIDQGGNKRPGSHALYLSPWHADMPKFLELRRPRGNEKERARELFYAFWNNDEFMWRVENDMEWWLMCPDQCPGLADVFNAEACTEFVDDEKVLSDPQNFAFSHKYRQYVREGRFVKKIKAREIWDAVLELQTEQGLPYMMYADNVNRKNNQANLGTIKSSNLCTEIVEFTSPEEVAVCNLASVCLPAFVEDLPSDPETWRPIKAEHDFVYNCSLETGKFHIRRFNMNRFKGVVKHMAKNLDSVIDINYYPVEEAKRSNLRHRPMGLGVQGLADLYAMLRLPFDSQEALRLNFYIFEAMYFAALDASVELAQARGSYESFKGSPASAGILQFDLLEKEGLANRTERVGGSDLQILFDRRQDWTSLKSKIKASGLRNSLFVAPMPTASTSYLMGNSPCIEPYNSNIYKRANAVGEFVVVNNLLINDLIDLGLWSDDMKNKIMLNNGSVQDIVEIPKNLRVLYKTAWDMSPKVIIHQAIARSPFVDQSQSMNLFIERPSPKVLTQIHFYTWRRGLKTGSYYIHSRPPVDAQKLQIADQQAVDLIKRSAPKSDEETDETQNFGMVCTMEDGCLSCGS
jgi:ribonucleoside-diphosphate reductase alpha subunit